MNHNTKEQNYQLSEQIYESMDKQIRIFKTRKRFSIQYLAVKVYTKKLYEGFTNECTILKSLSNPYIVKAYGSSEDYNYYYLELEYCLTGDLSKALMLNRQYNEPIVKHIGYQIMMALSNLHKNGILHCNLKPSNILIDDYGNIRLCDFKKSLRINNMNITDVKRHKTAITPCYTAPELFSEDGIFSYKTEIWALGCILFELATGQVPFFEESVAKLINKIVNEELNFSRLERLNFSEEFVEIIKKMLEKDPNKRFFWNDLLKQNLWEGPFPDAIFFDKSDSTSIKSASNSSRSDSGKLQTNHKTTISNPNLNNIDKKKIDVLRLSRNALKHMMEEKEDDYSDNDCEKSEVKNADQEFNFENQENADNDSRKLSESDEMEKVENLNIKEKLDKIQKLNPLEMSTVAVSKIMKRNKRKNQNVTEEYEKSVLEDTPTFENVMIHPSDKIIKPIIGNKTIEITTVTTFDKSKLQFSAWKIDKIKELYQTNIKSLEQFLQSVYTHMNFYFNNNDNDLLLNILSYFETIIQDKEIANNIINSSFVNVFVNLLKSSKNTFIKIRVCSIIGFLIRYSTVIDTPLDDLHLCKILDSCVKDKNEKLGRKAVATLGEYLFFVATQAEGEEEMNMNWNITDDSLLTLNWCLEKSDDEIIKFYVVKTIENISALTQISKLYFTKDERFLLNLIGVVNSTKNTDLKVSAIYSVSHIIRLEPKLFKIFIDKVGVVSVINLAEKENNKIQQALINILLNGIYKDNQIILKNEFLVPLCNFLLKLFDTPNNVIRIKIMLIFTLIFENSIIVSKFGEKIFNYIQKFRKENSLEMMQAIKVLENTVQIKIKVMVKNFIYLLSNNISNSNYHDEILQHFNSFLTYNSYTKLLPFVYTQDLLEILIKIIDSEYISEETITKNIFQLIANFSENPKCVLDNNDFILKKMVLPLLSVCLNTKIDNKILPLNIVANMITVILDDDKLYSSTVLDEGKTKIINNLVLQILPIFKEMLKKEDLIFSALSVLSIILERNSVFIKYVKSEGLLTTLLQIMEDKKYSNNLNLIKIAIRTIESNDIALEELLNNDIIEKINYLMSNEFGENNIYTEYIIELFYELMVKINNQKKISFNPNKPDFMDKFKVFTTKIEKVSKNFRICIRLLGNDNKNIHEKSCISLMYLLQIFGATYIESLGTSIRFTSNDIPDLLKGLDLNRNKIHKRVIKIFLWMFEYQKEDLQNVLGQYVSWISTLIETICDLTKDQDTILSANQLCEKLNKLKFK